MEVGGKYQLAAHLQAGGQSVAPPSMPAAAGCHLQLPFRERVPCPDWVIHEPLVGVVPPSRGRAARVPITVGGRFNAKSLARRFFRHRMT
jgi:hypothetical protein